MPFLLHRNARAIPNVASLAGFPPTGSGRGNAPRLQLKLGQIDDFHYDF
jgi:hypothetical protein